MMFHLSQSYSTHQLKGEVQPWTSNLHIKHMMGAKTNKNKTFLWKAVSQLQLSDRSAEAKVARESSGIRFM